MTDACDDRSADTRTMPSIRSTSKRRVVTVASMLAVALGALGAIDAVPAGARREITATRPIEPVLATAAARPPSPPPRPNPTPRLPVPAPLPGRWDRVALVEVGRIEIPKIGVRDVVREGVEQMVIDAGPAHWPGTAAFGGWGNVVLAGHRSTLSEPFRRAAELVPGDEIFVSVASGQY
jgi:hypothetical protein